MKKILIPIALLLLCCCSNENSLSNSRVEDTDSVLSEYRFVIKDSLGNEHLVDSITFEEYCKEISKNDPMFKKMDSADMEKYREHLMKINELGIIE